jgi:hypothetical protein
MFSAEGASDFSVYSCEKVIEVTNESASVSPFHLTCHIASDFSKDARSDLGLSERWIQLLVIPGSIHH